LAENENFIFKMGAQISDLRYENGVLGITQVVTLQITAEKIGITKRTLFIPFVNCFRGFDESFQYNFSKNDFEIILRKDDNKLIFILDTESIATSITVTFGFVSCKPVGYSFFEMIEGISFSKGLENRIKNGRIFMEEVNLPFDVKNERKLNY